jgi:serine/threonine-protein kinase
MIPLLIISFVLLVLVIGGVAVVTSRDDGDGGSAGGQAGSSGGVTDTASSETDTRDTASSATQPDDADSAAPATVPASTTSNTTIAPDPRAEALLSLADRLETDRPSVDAHLERWVPQVSAKRDGLVWQETEFGFPEIWAEHLDLDARYGALLVSGAEYTFELDGQRMDGWFITIVDQSWSDPEGALNWCRSNGIDRDNCAAKLITNNPDADRTFVTQ